MRQSRGSTPEQIIGGVFSAVESLRRSGITLVSNRRRGQAFGRSVVEALAGAGFSIVPSSDWREFDEHRRRRDCHHPHWQCRADGGTFCTTCGADTTTMEAMGG